MSKIVFAGHSIVKGTDYGGVTRTDTFAYKIGTAAGYASADIYIKGVSGDTSAGLLARLQADVIGLAPDVCVIMIGANDWSTGVSVATFTANLRLIASKVIGAGIKLVLMTDNMNRGSVAEFVSLGTYEDAIRKVSVEYNCPLVDIFSRMCFKALCNDYTQYYAGTTDKIHFSIAGHTWAAQVSSETSPKDAFVKVTSTPPVVVTEPTAQDVQDLSVAISDYLINGQLTSDLSVIEQIRSRFP
ncbi:SGNH/GDSL hydrolase family protein [Pseudomonas mediterranea]|jgi:lysophospholipase L1-like esterase|uniref:Lysophospholipase L1 n=1 Tax=Pseudomonas mediterranea TaxID=183795 RepID=A0AAX2DIN4_9PSED|nr:GDSL-type esterase/lipase family protein [Pseudomonas mediterranea]KGU84817.1 hypothetical protein N005_15750 [Pseudomonas mediterranea CFBP 5447]SDU74581.1 Lysophospholipase L1 [Pseudomonas mediterranea]